MLPYEKVHRLFARKGQEQPERPKALVALAFRNGPIENVHAGKACPTCQGDPQYSHITQAEMRQIMKAAVDRLHTFLVLKQAVGPMSRTDVWYMVRRRADDARIETAIGCHTFRATGITDYLTNGGPHRGCAAYGRTFECRDKGPLRPAQ
jgi:hypothetical protein